jgi:hypothetical protein
LIRKVFCVSIEFLIRKPLVLIWFGYITAFNNIIEICRKMSLRIIFFSVQSLWGHTDTVYSETPFSVGEKN